MAGYIDLKKLNLDELAGVVSLYPWYGAARVELCRRMSRMGGESWGKADYAAAALYVRSRRVIGDLFSGGKGGDGSDRKVSEVIKTYIREPEPQAPQERRVHVVGGDFFSQAQYDKVRSSSDNVFTRFAFKARSEAPEKTADFDVSEEFCTETLAKIYAEQGYYEQAKRIYSKLLLNFPRLSSFSCLHKGLWNIQAFRR